MAIRVREDETFSLDLTPMIDVVFLLIIFFLVATTFQQLERQMQVEVPHSDTGAGEEGGSAPIVVNVLQDGSIVVGGRAIDLEELHAILARAVADDPATKALIRADGGLRFQRVVDVSSTCRRAKIGFSYTVRPERGGG